MVSLFLDPIISFGEKGHNVAPIPLVKGGMSCMIDSIHTFVRDWRRLLLHTFQEILRGSGD